MAWDVPGERDPETGATLFAHVYLLPQKGVYIIENLNLEELARDRRYAFRVHRHSAEVQRGDRLAAAAAGTRVMEEDDRAFTTNADASQGPPPIRAA